MKTPQKMKKTPYKYFPTILILLLLNGCQHYHLGNPPTKVAFSTLYIQPVQNNSYAPQLQGLLSSQIRQTFLLENNIRLVSTEAEAEATLSITLTKFSESPITLINEETSLGRSFNTTLEASYSLINNKAGKPYFSGRKASASVTVFIDGGIQPSRYQSMPALTAELANTIKNNITNTW